MATESVQLLLTIGLIVVGAFFASLIFQRIRIPDIIFLILLGLIMGPVTHVADVHLFEKLANFVGTVAIIIILFEGGLKIRKSELLSGVASGALLALLVFVATSLLCALVGHWALGLEPGHALILGMALAGAGVVIVIPLIQQMGVTPRFVTIVSMEAAISDVLVVLGVVGLSAALAVQGQTDALDFTRGLVLNFIIGIVAGVAAGYAWTRGLRAFTERSYEYVLTIALLFLVYAGTELVRGSGPIAVLMFGLVVGNSRKTQLVAQEPARRQRRKWEWVPVFGGELQNLHHEVVFFVRAFFFVMLGALVDLELFTNPRFLGVGALLTLGVIAGRYWGVQLLYLRKNVSSWDRLSVALMFPLGLAAAVLSLTPWQRFQIPGTQDFGAYATVAIILTNLISAIAVFVLANPRWGFHRRQTATATPTH